MTNREAINLLEEIKVNKAYTEAFEMALKALEAEEAWYETHEYPHKEQWIPVSSGKLPEKYIGEWLCCTDDGKIMILPYDTPGDGSKKCVFYYWEDDYTVVKPNVVAWMPLPEAFQGE